MRATLRLAPALLGGLSVVVAACSSSHSDASADSSAAAGPTASTTASATANPGDTATPPPHASDAPARPGDLRITTPDSGFVLALAGDSVWMGLSDSVLSRVRFATDSARTKAAASKDGGVGGAFGKMIVDQVTAAVDAGLGSRVAYSLADIQNVAYENGTIRFTYRPGAKHAISFEDVTTGGKGASRPMLSTFAPADAERFVAAVHARAGSRMTSASRPATP